MSLSSIAEVAKRLSQGVTPSEGQIVAEAATLQVSSAFTLDMEDFKFKVDPNVLSFKGWESIDDGYCYIIEIETFVFFELEDLLKKHITIRHLTHHHGLERVFSGHIGEIKQTHSDIEESNFRYQVKIYPLLWFLRFETRFCSFHNQSTLGFTQQTLARWGINNVEYNVTDFGAITPKEYLVQYGESTLNFLKRMWTKKGIIYYYNFTEGREELTLLDGGRINSDNAHLMHFSYKKSPDPHTNSIFDFTKSKRSHFEAHVIIEDDPSADSISQALGQMEKSTMLSSTYPGNFTNPLEGLQLLEKQKLCDKISGHTYTARTNDVNLQAGQFIEVHEHEHDELNQKYFVTNIEHNFVTDKDGDRHYSNLLTLKVCSNGYASEGIPIKPKIEGVQRAIVVGDDPNQPHCDELGRVQINLPWDIDRNFLTWVPVAQSIAGDSWGSQFTPRPGMEVLVSYINGDPEQPIVVGSLYNNKNKPAYGPHFSPLTSGFVSKSSDGECENKLLFIDEENSEEIKIEAANHLKISAKDSYTKISKGDATTELQKGAINLDIKKGYHRKVNGKTTTSITKDGRNDKIEGGWQTHIASGDGATTIEKGNLKITISHGDADIEIAGKGRIKVSGELEIHSDKEIKIKANVITADTEILKVKATSAELNCTTGTISATSFTLRGESIDFKAATKISLDTPIIESMTLERMIKAKI